MGKAAFALLALLASASAFVAPQTGRLHSVAARMALPTDVSDVSALYDSAVATSQSLASSMQLAALPTLEAPSEAQVSSFLLNPLTLTFLFVLAPAGALFVLITLIMPALNSQS